MSEYSLSTLGNRVLGETIECFRRVMKEFSKAEGNRRGYGRGADVVLQFALGLVEISVSARGDEVSE
jgi:hypothetical protein